MSSRLLTVKTRRMRASLVRGLLCLAVCVLFALLAVSVGGGGVSPHIPMVRAAPRTEPNAVYLPIVRGPQPDVHWATVTDVIDGDTIWG